MNSKASSQILIGATSQCLESAARMDELYGISLRGYVWELKNWREKNPHLPLNSKYTAHCRTPLHLAAMRNHVKFVEELLSYNSQLILEIDSHGFTPLHLVSGRPSNIRLVKKLLAANTDVCMYKDEDGRTPLYLAVMKNNVKIIEELIKEKPEAIHIRYDQNETILHMCVKHNSTEALILLVGNLTKGAQSENMDAISVNSKKDDGNTILHLAADKRKWMCLRCLLYATNIGIDINALNNKDEKALYMLNETERDFLETSSYMKKGKKTSQEWMLERVNALMVVATLIAGIAFQAAMNPPGDVFTYYLGSVANSSKSSHFDRYLKTLSQNTTQTQNTTKIVRSANFVRELLETLHNVSYSKSEASFAYVTSKYPGIVLEHEKWNKIISEHKPKFAPYLIRYAGTPILYYKNPKRYRIYMTCNALAFIVSLSIIMLVIGGFIYENSINQHIRVLVGLMAVSILALFISYVVVFISMAPPFYANKDELRTALFVCIPIFCICMFYILVHIWEKKDINNDDLEDIAMADERSHAKAFIKFAPVLVFIVLLASWYPVFYREGGNPIP